MRRGSPAASIAQTLPHFANNMPPKKRDSPPCMKAMRTLSVKAKKTTMEAKKTMDMQVMPMTSLVRLRARIRCKP